ncbi:unnamed protein product [Adineta ricciae]|uniref:Uncharacterized protein n=1 Tax=Adineta ricciae TaxID=249248 RepID=A0A815AQ58_ADIRI|nr:unnamed protein product [Adineta ricciae]
MNISHLILFTSLLLTTNAQWFIKKSDRAKQMSYPNPGKRNVPDQEPTYPAIDCSIPYLQLQTYEQRATWLLLCTQKASLPSDFFEDLMDFNSNGLDLKSTSSEKVHLPRKRSTYAVPPYFKDDDFTSNRMMRKVLRRFGNDK